MMNEEDLTFGAEPHCLDRLISLGLDGDAAPADLAPLAHTYCHLGEYREAERLLRNTFYGGKAKLRPNHPHTVESLKQLVTLYESWPKPDEAARWRAKLAEMKAIEQ